MTKLWRMYQLSTWLTCSIQTVVASVKHHHCRCALIVTSSVAVIVVIATIRCCLGKVVDLTHTYGWDVIYPPIGQGLFNFTTILKGHQPALRNHWLEMSWFAVFEHGSTHIDAPAHYKEGGAYIHEVSAENLIGPGVMINITSKGLENRDYLMTIEDIQEWETENGQIPNGAIVMINTGKHKFYPNRTLFYDTETPDDDTSYHNPGLHPMAARWLRNNRHIKALGTDAHSCDPGQNNQRNPCHEELLSNGVLLLEFVANLDQMPKTGSTVFAGAIKMRNGSGGPTRIMALCGEDGNAGAIVSYSSAILYGLLLSRLVFRLTFRL